MRGLSDLTLASRFRSFSHISSVFAIAVGLLTLVGWLADIQVLKSIAPLLPSMKANSALCLVLVGLALWLVQERSSLGAADRPRKDLISRNASIVCAGSVALVACLTFLEYALGWDFRIDQLLFSDAAGPFEMTPAGRMAPATALDYLFLSVALILLTRKADRAFRASQFLSLAVGVLSLLALVGYAYSAYQTYDLTYHRSMALHEAGALVIFSAAVLFARPQSGYVLTMTGQGHVGILVRRLLPWAVGIPFLLGWLRLEAERNGIQLTDIEFSLFVVSNMVIFSVLIWASARSLVATEQALVESEERYHSIFANSDDAILLTVPDGRILAANSAACQIFGRTEEEICQVGRRGLVDSSDPRLLLALEERERTGSFKGELTFVHRNGERFPAEVTSTVFHDSQRNPRTSMIIRDITERKRAEEALRESEERYRSLVEAAPDVIYTISAEDGSLTSLNPAFEALTGWSRAEWLGKPFMGIVHPDDRLVAVETYQKASRGKAPPPYELRILSKSGEYLVGEFTSTPYVKGSKVVGELGIARDITERKHTEEKLRKSEERYRTLFEGDLAGDYVSTPEGKLIACNAAFARVFRFKSVDDALATNTYELYPNPGARSLFLQSVRENGCLEFQEAWMKRRDGTDVHIIENVRGVFDERGELVELQGYLFDDTERKLAELANKQAEEALRESEERFRRLSEASFEGILIHEEGKIIDLNRTFAIMFGYDISEVIGRNAVDFATPELRDVALRHVRTESTEPYEGVAIRKDGSTFPVEVQAQNILYEGRIARVTALRDITERKRAEEALRLEKENFRHSLDESPLGVRIVTADGDTLYANRAILDFYGYDSLEELRKTPLRARYTPDSYAEFQKRKQQRERGDSSTSEYEISIVRKNGEVLHLQVHRKQVLWDSAKQFLVIYQDITERKRAEEEIKNLAKFPSENPSPVLRLSQDGTLLYANEASQVLLRDWGCTLGSYVPSFWRNVVADAHTSQSRRTIDVKLGEQTYSFVIAPVLNAGYVNLYGRDITERKRAEEALRESEERYRSLVEAAPDVVYTISAEDGSLTSLNPAFETITGWSRAEWLGKPFMGIVHPDDRSAAVETFQKALRGEAPPLYQLRILSKSGEYLVGEFTSTPFVMGGKAVGELGIARDITERKLAELASKRAEEELKTAKSRLQRLSHRLLEVQENDRRAVARELHDEIGQILTAAKIDLQVVRRGNIPEDLASRLDENIASLDNCLSRVRNLSLDLRPSMLDDLGLVAALRWQLNRQAERAGFQVHLVAEDAPERLHPELETVCYRIVQEALTNIAKHAHAHNVWVELTSSDREVLLSVRDDGVGFHVESALADAAHGASFGILGMQERASLLGGKLEIVSAREKGTTVTARFPLR